jgi:hypothetical protein
MNNRIHELEQNLIEIQQRIEKIQKDIGTYQKLSTEHLTEIGAIRMYGKSIKIFYYKYLFSRAIESMFDLVKRYSHRSRKKDLNINNLCLFNKLKQVIFCF